MSRSLLLVLLVLACLQSFTEAQNVVSPTHCCFKFQSIPIPEKITISYRKTQAECTKPGVIFYVTKGRLACANPMDVWVQNLMKAIDKHVEA